LARVYSNFKKKTFNCSIIDFPNYSFLFLLKF